MNLLFRKAKPRDQWGQFHNDKELATRAANRDEAALEEIFMTYKDRVFSLCLRMAGDYHLAEDLLQDSFLRAFRSLGQYRGDSALGTWLYRVAVNTVVSSFRQKQQGLESLEENSQEVNQITGSEKGKEEQLGQTIDLERAMALLPLGYRAVLVLHDVEGWEHEDIAALQGFSVGNSKSQLYKARMKMRALLQGSKNGFGEAREH